jgi:excisionase family DNA binding protein
MGTSVPSSGHPSEAQVAILASVRPPFPAPSLFDLADFVDDQAEDLKELCEQLHVAFEACAQDIDPRLDDEEMFDPIAARFLWQHVPDIRNIASRASVLGFWLQVLRGVVDIEKRQAGVAPPPLPQLTSVEGEITGAASGGATGADRGSGPDGPPRRDVTATFGGTSDRAAADSDGRERHVPPFLTAREAAAQLRVAVGTVYEAVKAGRLPAVRVGRSIRIPRHAVDAAAPAESAAET